MKSEYVRRYILERIKREQSKRQKHFLIEMPQGAGGASLIGELLIKEHFRTYRGERKRLKGKGISVIIVDRLEQIASLKDELQKQDLTVEILKQGDGDSYSGDNFILIDTVNNLRSITAEYHPYYAASRIITYGLLHPAEVPGLFKHEVKKYADWFFINSIQHDFELPDVEMVRISIGLADVIAPFDMEAFKKEFENWMNNNQEFQKLYAYLQELPEGFFQRNLQMEKNIYIKELGRLHSRMISYKNQNQGLIESGDGLRTLDSIDRPVYYYNRTLIQPYKQTMKKLYKAIIQDYGQ